MTTDELISVLRDRYDNANRREVALAIHLFGIEYAAELDGQPINTIAEAGTGHRSYGTEIRKGMRLAKYVQMRAPSTK